ncbi:PREDICTED: tRNA (uracil-5-)-methyltransferase homolog A-like isoform X2 [Ceratosolen solmsi marchali]|nr:PREDICTED: tRNA (uracil-5-)-methyltransferase homolog A-like isoform X2 [Ceratosolen solmsi marchali]XP_011500832.1 PREDICTED: tRNA (uracil-5-)-methyltransferase homolog A-like isoform X2 [Ceratosolen solmsi marchali]
MSAEADESQENSVNEVNKETKQGHETTKEDLYAYLERDCYTTEKFKVEIRGLPKYYGIGELKKFLNEKLCLNANKIKPPRKGSGWAYVCFRNNECRDKAISVLNGIKWKHAQLTAHVANPAPDPYMKRKLEKNDECSKKMKIGANLESILPEDQIKSNTIPLWNMPYDEQLEFKQNEMKNIIDKMGKQILKVNKDLAGWLNKQKEDNDGLPCKLGKIVHSNVIEGYRNKCEFTVGIDVTGKQKMIGFRLSSYAAGSIAVGPIDHLCHIPKRMKIAIKILEKFIHNSELDVFNPITHSGYWRQVSARTTRLDHLMLIIGIHPQNMTGEDKKKLQLELKQFFEQDSNSIARVTSLYFQTIEKKAAGGEGGGIIEHVSGLPYIEEALLGMTFRISPEAFFQINSLCAEELYKTAIDLMKPTTDTALLDVCCGTGTIGLIFAKHCEEVFGIEMVPNAIEDAKVNATKNNVSNCEFFVGKAEDILLPVINRTKKSNVVAIVDPPRAGLHQKALVALRKIKQLNKLVYISCNPNAAIKNLVDLARPNSKQYFGEPLVPIKAIPVDMFPYTKHCELVLYLERLPLVKESIDEM